HRQRRESENRDIKREQVKESLIVADDEYGKVYQRQHDHKRGGEITGQSKELLEFHTQGQSRIVPHTAKQFHSDLHDSLCPAALLRLECVYFDRQFGGHIIVGQINESPAHQLRSIRKIGVLGERVVLPAAGPLDRFAAPHTGRAVEIEEPAASIARDLLDHKMTVEHDRLDLRQQRIVRVDVAPAHLHHTDSLVGEEVKHLADAIGPGNKVGVEDQNQFARRFLEPRFERAGLEAFAVLAMMIDNVNTLIEVFVYRGRSDLLRVVGGIIQHLDLEQFSRVLELDHRVDQTFGDIHFVEQWELDGDSW